MMSSAENRPAHPGAGRERLVELLRGFVGTQLLYAATSLGVPDVLHDAARSAAELAKATGADLDSLVRVLDGLVALEVIGRDSDGKYESTPLLALLQSDVDSSFRDAALFYGDIYYRAWSSLREALRTGANAFELTFGTSFWRYLSEHPDLAASFSAAMARNSQREADEVASLVDASGARTIIDVGGGNGVLVAAVLSRHATLRGVVIDLPTALGPAEPHLKALDLDGRCELLAGDFFAAVPPCGDVYVLKAILHNWDDERAVTILRNCRRAMHRDARLYVVERLRSDDVHDRARVMADLEMFVLFSGRERSLEETRELLDASNLRLRGLETTSLGASVLEVVPDGGPITERRSSRAAVSPQTAPAARRPLRHR